MINSHFFLHLKNVNCLYRELHNVVYRLLSSHYSHTLQVRTFIGARFVLRRDSTKTVMVYARSSLE